MKGLFSASAALRPEQAPRQSTPVTHACLWRHVTRRYIHLCDTCASTTTERSPQRLPFQPWSQVHAGGIAILLHLRHPFGTEHPATKLCSQVQLLECFKEHRFKELVTLSCLLVEKGARIRERPGLRTEHCGVHLHGLQRFALGLFRKVLLAQHTTLRPCSQHSPPIGSEHGRVHNLASASTTSMFDGPNSKRQHKTRAGGVTETMLQDTQPGLTQLSHRRASLEVLGGTWEGPQDYSQRCGPLRRFS